MKKRLLAIFAAVLMVMSMFTAVQAAEEPTIVVNGGFEMEAVGWTMPPEASVVSGENAYEGNGAIKITSSGNAFAYQYVELVSGETYEISFDARAFDNGGAIVKFEMFNNDTWQDAVSLNWEIGTQWTECKDTFTVPAGINRAQMLIRLIGGGTVYYDNVKLTGAVSESLKSGIDADANASKTFAAEKAKNVKADDAYGKNFVYNGNFEYADANGVAEGVEASDDWSGKNVALDNSEKHGGNYALKLSSDNGEYPWAAVSTKDVVGGVKYQLSFWYKGENVSKDNPFKVVLEGYKEETPSAESKLFTAQTYDLPSAKTWTEVTYNFTLPETCELVTITPKVYPKNGTLYIDDVSFYMIEEPVLFEFDTDQVFYYSHLETGMASAILRPMFDDIGYTANFTLSDEGKVLAKAAGVKFAENKMADWMFSLGLLAEKGKAYVLKTEVFSPEGELLSSYDQNVYKYDKPEVMTEDGTFVIDGKPYYPAMIYHTEAPADMKEGAELGLNLLQTVYNGTEGIPGWISLLDQVHENGFKAAVVCYWGMKHAGDPVNVKRIAEFVEAIKDHPAVFCYMTMDEPLGHYPDDENLKNIMETAYKTIRDIDPVHPIYHCEASIAHYDMALKYTDVVGIDPYPGSGKPFETHVADATVIAEESSAPFGKGVIQILQTFTYGKSPSETNLHSMMYQSLMGGADANGIYPWVMDEPEIDGYALPDTKWYAVFEDFKELEYDITWKHYGKLGLTEWFYTTKENDYWIDMWVDGKDVYAAVLNRLAEEQVISVPATSQNGLVTIADYTVTPVNGDASVTKTDAGFDITMPASAALLFKVTSNTDFSAVNAFNDLENYAWAAEAIEELYALGVANDKGEFTYEPGTAITRGDFAMYLVKALGIDKTVAFTDNFNDVDVHAEYAAAVAAGKKAGILQGVGNNNFNPESAITRQDLLVICARGMRYVKELAEADASVLDSFSDKGLIADYAAADMAAMVQSGIVKGNTDGTVNPLGNTTRAESAVIMDRITEWNK